MLKRWMFCAVFALPLLVPLPARASCAHAPVAVTDVFNMPRNTLLTILDSTLASNDTDADLDTLHAGIAGAPTYGSYCGIGPDGVCYQPPTNFTGLDAIPYAVTDGCTYTNGTILIFVQ